MHRACGRLVQPAADFRKPPTEESPDVDRAEKKAAIETLNGVFKASNVVVVAHYSGLTVAQMQISAQADAAGWRLGEGREKPSRQDRSRRHGRRFHRALLKGPTVIAYSSDVIAAPKVATDFAKANEKFVILGGAMGKTALNPDGVKALASLPSLDELRAKLVGLIQAPATKIAQVVNAPAAKVARVVQAYASKSDAA